VADKLRTSFTLPVEFVTGELPSAAKMNAVSSQAKTSARLLEYAIGDLWNQAGDPLLTAGSLTENALMIPNLARHVGAAKLLSPRIPSLPNIEEYTWEPHPTNEVGGHEGSLTFKPHGASTYSWGGTGTPSATPEASLGDVDAAGEWYVDADSGQAYFYDAIGADWKLSYRPIIDGDLGADATFNIMPDPETFSSYAFQGVKIQYVNGTDNSLGYYIFLPPRGPIDRKIDQSPQDDEGIYVNTDNYQTTTPLASNPNRIWQGDLIDAEIADTTTAEHYRYVLPKIITDNMTQAAAFPQGLIYLWDHNNTGTILEGLSLSAENVPTPRKFIFVASGSALDAWLSTTAGALAYPEANLKSSDHTPVMYPSGGLRVMTTGSSLADVVSELVRLHYNHDHSTPTSPPGKVIPHHGLGSTFDPGSSPQLDPSTLANDDHPQYLHRKGASRDKFNNSMLSDLLLASTGSASNYQNLTSHSQKLVFGDLADGPQMYMNAGANRLFLQIPSAAAGNCEGFRIQHLAASGGILDMSLNNGDGSAYISSTNGGLRLTTPGGSNHDMIFTAGADAGTSVSFKFQPGTGHIELGLSSSGAGKLFFTPAAENDYIQWNDFAQGWIFAVNNDQNNSLSKTTFPGTVEIRSTGDPALSFFNHPGPEDTKLEVSTLGEVAIKRSDKTGLSEGTVLYAGKIRPGGHSDSDFGYSGPSTDVYGPVRELYISPGEFQFFEGGAGYLTYAGGAYGLGISPSPATIRGYGGTINDPPTQFTGEIEVGGVGNQKFAICYPKIAAAKFVVVGVRMTFRHRTYVGTTPANAFIARLGHFSTSGGASALLTSIDLQTAIIARGGGVRATDVWSGYFDIFTPLTILNYGHFNQSKPGDGERLWFSLEHNAIDASLNQFEWQGVSVLYRIEEY